jgi:hypothetical protein
MRRKHCAAAVKVLAVWEAPAQDSEQLETTWGEHVTNDEYRAAAEQV